MRIPEIAIVFFAFSGFTNAEACAPLNDPWCVNAIESTIADGSGFAIAIVDSGIDTSHPLIKDKVVAQACFSVVDERAGIESLCHSDGIVLPTGDVIDTSEKSAEALCQTDPEICRHGTQVAGLAAGSEAHTSSGDRIAGVAEGADIVAVQVFSRFTQSFDCVPEPAPCLRVFQSSHLRALQWIHSLALNYLSTGQGPRIAVVNMSLGAGHFRESCDFDSILSRRIRRLRDNGIATIVAAGNDGFTGAVSHPGCIESALTVGSMTRDRLVASFSNRHPNLIDLMALGDRVITAQPGGGFELQNGTSFSAPIASGAYGVLRSALPFDDNKGSLIVETIENAMKTTGQPYAVDEFDGLEYPAPNLTAAYNGLKSLLKKPADASDEAINPEPIAR